MDNPAVMDLREMDVLRFFFELNHQKMDHQNLQQILLQHQLQNQMKQQTSPSNYSSFSSPVFRPKENNISTPDTSRVTNIPEPKIVFQYVQSPRFPTPTSTPEPESADESIQPSNEYQKATRKSKSFHTENRASFIKLKDDQRKLLMTPTSSIHESDSEHDHNENSQIPLTVSTKIKTWQNTSIYNNLPEIVMREYDELLRASHSMKIEVVTKLNEAFPVSYDYNPKKSRIRTNYNDPHVADDRTKNNIASRRSRQRKKFLNHVLQYSVDFDDDENFLLKKQEQWLRKIVASMENKILNKNSLDDEKIYKLRRQCGFE